MTQSVKRFRRGAILPAIALCVTLLVACSSGSKSVSEKDTLHVLAGSELKDMQPILDDALKATGIELVPTYAGSLDGAEQVAAGAQGVDAAWFASDRYIALAGASSKILARQRIAVSPVVVGVRDDVAQRLGWANGAHVSWRDIAKAAADGKFHYAMTNPTASNSGFSALVSVADALAGGSALTASSIDRTGLQGFLSGQALSSGSSGFLVDAYVRDESRLDGLVNYESVLVSLNDSHRLQHHLTLVYPNEGIVTADYPLMLLNPQKRAAYDKLSAYLTRRDVQAKMQQLTARRAVTPGVPADPRLSKSLLVEASFPANLTVTRTLLEDYANVLRRPADTVYVLDVSGSMQGDRLSNLQKALGGLAGLDTSFSGVFTRFSPREHVTLIPFNDSVGKPQSFAIDSPDPQSPTLVSLRNYVNALQADGGTAIYSALDRAYDVALDDARANPNAYTSIVMMTDGENNYGISSDQFLNRMRNRPSSEHDLRVFTVLFGEAEPKALQDIADATGGTVFDARKANLSQVFKEIRGYQ
jgi:Ca-activated chloride channel family protein